MGIRLNLGSGSLRPSWSKPPMPYNTNSELPKPVRDALPSRAQSIWREAYNSAQNEWVHIDKHPFGNPTLLHDLNKGLPMYEDSSVEEIYARGVLMLLDDPVFQLNEWWRVLKPGGTLRLVIPLVDLDLAAACNHPATKHLWSNRTLMYFLGERPGAWYSGFSGHFERAEPPTTEGEHRCEVWRAVK